METATQDRARRLFQFLQEFTALKFKPQRTSDNDSLLWFSNLPEEKEIEHAARLSAREGTPDEWLVIRKPKLHPAPTLPDLLEPWVKGPLDQADKPPAVHTQRVVETQILDDDLLPQRIQDTLFLDQEPEVLALWTDYERRWQTWAAEERRARTVQAKYLQLFDMHQKLASFGETYELRLGFGYLAWRTPDGVEVRRHLLTAQANLTFDALNGVLSVTAGGDGARTTLEQDMLEPHQRPLTQVTEEIQRVLAEDGEDLWSENVVPKVLQQWVNAVEGRGVYVPELTPLSPGGVTSNPVVHWAPALILRRRGERSLGAAYGDILRKLPELDSVPRNLAGFISTPEERPAGEGTGQSGEVYFPLPANDAQLDIIRRLGRQQGVLVQGPPGTGKSHTIVNLVSHLLATDQRVLVTSHTARALKVLRDKFPAELAALCVTHLRGEEGARAMLEGSVQQILERSTTRDARKERQTLELLSARLETDRQQEDRLLDTLRDIRERETNTLDLFGYQGTAQRIGEQLRQQEAAFSWIADLVSPDRPAPLTDAEALRLLALLRDFGEGEIGELRQQWPDTAALVSPEEFVRFTLAERESQARAEEHQAARAHPHYAILRDATPEARQTLLATVQALDAAAETGRRHPSIWLGRAVTALLQGQTSLWEEIQSRTTELLPELQRRADWLEQTGVTGLEGLDPQTVRNDAGAVLAHLEGGGKWGGLFGKPAAVKGRLYLKDSVRVGGRPAETPEALRDLLEYLALTSRLARLEAVWQAAEVQTSGPVKLRVRYWGEQQALLQSLSNLKQQLDQARQAVAALPGLPQPQWWEPGELRALVRAAQAADTELDAQARRKMLEDLLPRLDVLLTSLEAHPVVEELRQATQARDSAAYGQAHARLLHLTARRERLAGREDLLGKLRSAAPAFADELTASARETAWDERLGNLEAAWRWQQAEARLAYLANPDTEVDVREQLVHTRQRIRDTLRDLAATHAWKNTLDRLQNKELQGLEAWRQAMKKLGKGTGKNADLYRRLARQALEQARTAIPAWIMPLHLVAESFPMEPSMFDVVIVDEASQAGPEALFLAFIAKKIIIVGDDKQIEPEGVGLQLAQVSALAHRFLFDFPAGWIISSPKASLFSFGAYTYPPMISLREHFRCMPEIIKFSSDLSYENHPLMALRQFGADRLQPLVARHVENGYTLSKRGDKVNPPEVRAIVDQIKACLNSPRYAGKTFGVISLLGDSQAEEIAALLRAEVPEAELERRRLVCGNAYSFQGDERDVIFLSMVDSPAEGRRSTLRSRDDGTFQPRYNVAVSRARDQLWLFHSVDLPHLHPDDLRASLIRHVRAPELEQFQPLARQRVLELREQAARPGRGRNPAPAPFDSWFEVDVYLSLVERGYCVVPQYEMNGYRVDLVVEGLRGRLAVECDGDHWHGPERYLQDLHRQQTLERAGMQFWRVRGSTYARDPEVALEDLWRTLDARGVFPEGDPRNYEALPDDTGLVPSGEELQVSEEASSLTEEASHTDALTSGMTEEVDSVDALFGDAPHRPALAAYTHWSAHTLPDPRDVDSLDPLVEGLREIIAAEGPMLCRQAYQTYTRAAGVNYGKAVQSQLNKAVTKGLRAGIFEQTDEWGTPGQVEKVVRLAGTPAVRLRERGPRDLTDVPPLELAALMHDMLRLEPMLDMDGNPEPLLRRVLVAHGGKQLTLKRRHVLERAYHLLQARLVPAVTEGGATVSTVNTER
ncbi:hypothetical protein DEIPH_ctg032orf0104 [Deinococcus phoenicis]|uniref:DNA helicase n=1 Tax=Deinococcus phoenicis TaxID=1476583 RepID=A0A016QP49_9DEIO|nr:AAA domain-containing protein [Deinococcus phoenicis]EYB67853.1 hypothetical protein DEIPH_ctg032orf0104 [Deinococcus phoenicis]